MRSLCQSFLKPKGGCGIVTFGASMSVCTSFCLSGDLSELRGSHGFDTAQAQCLHQSTGSSLVQIMFDFYTPRNKVRGGILDSACLSVCPSVCLSFCPSVCPLTFRVRPHVASTVQDGCFPYLVQMITSMRRCVACDDLWPWPISSRSFDLD